MHPQWLHNTHRPRLLSLDLSHNCLCDLRGTVSTLHSLLCLRSLMLTGNPLTVSTAGLCTVSMLMLHVSTNFNLKVVYLSMEVPELRYAPWKYWVRQGLFCHSCLLNLIGCLKNDFVFSINFIHMYLEISSVVLGATNKKNGKFSLLRLKVKFYVQ